MLFFGKAGCGECHTGRLLTDQDYHTMAAPQVGPGREPHSPRDFGNAAAGGGAGERYAFRTPPLRNVTLTGPWTHAGAYDNLEDVVHHFLDPVGGLTGYDPGHLAPEVAAASAGTMAGNLRAILDFLERRPIEPIALTDDEVGLILIFLGTLTDPAAADLSYTIPDSVPSGLPVER